MSLTNSHLVCKIFTIGTCEHLRASSSSSVVQTFPQILLKLLKISLASNSSFFHQNGSCQILSPNLTLKIYTPFFFLLFYLILAPSSLLHCHLPLAFLPAFLPFFTPKPKILFSTPGSHWRNPRHPRLPQQQRRRRVVHLERDWGARIHCEAAAPGSDHRIVLLVESALKAELGF